MTDRLDGTNSLALTLRSLARVSSSTAVASGEGVISDSIGEDPNWIS